VALAVVVVEAMEFLVKQVAHLELLIRAVEAGVERFCLQQAQPAAPAAAVLSLSRLTKQGEA
jgi:hypothetical protein